MIVVGRNDTGDLEAQIRGSRFAGEIRIISVGALLRLMNLRENLTDPKTIKHICEILIPKEYIRLDDIVDLVFSVVPKSNQKTAVGKPSEDNEEKTVDTDEKQPTDFRAACIQKWTKKKGVNLDQKTEATYASYDEKVRVVCAVSTKAHEARSAEYWFAFHLHQNKFLAEAGEGFVILGCGTLQQILSIPYKKLKPLLKDLGITYRKNGQYYWHMKIRWKDDKFWLVRKDGKEKVLFSQYLIES